MEQMDLIKSFIGITCVDDYEKWNEEIFSQASEEECDEFWEWADSALFNQIWETLAQKMRATCPTCQCNDHQTDCQQTDCQQQIDCQQTDCQQQIECDMMQFEFVPDITQEHIIKYFCGSDLPCSLILTAPLEFDVEEIEYEDNILTFTGVVFDC